MTPEPLILDPVSVSGLVQLFASALGSGLALGGVLAVLSSIVARR